MIGGLGAKSELPVLPKAVELRFASFANMLGGGLMEKTEGYSDMNESWGKVSTAYCGGPTGTPHRLWWGAASWSKDTSLRRCCLGSGEGSVFDLNMTLESRSTQIKSSSGSSSFS